MTDAPREIWVWPDGDGWGENNGPDWGTYGGFIKGFNGPCHWMGKNSAKYIRADIAEAERDAAYTLGLGKSAEDVNAAYKRGLEDAARLVDYHASTCTGRDDRDFLGGIAAAIRAMIQERNDDWSTAK